MLYEKAIQKTWGQPLLNSENKEVPKSGLTYRRDLGKIPKHKITEDLAGN